MKKHESIRIFKNPVLEACTHVHPVIPVLIWGPFSIYLIYQSLAVQQIDFPMFIIYAIIGLVVWTLIEYVLHRYVFHFKAKSFLGKSILYLFHGLHHDDPQDPTRLLMPPVPAVIYLILLWQFFSLCIPARYLETFMAFFIIGYLCYDYIHYGTHHFKMNGTIGKYLKRHHLKHHFAHEDSKYGVSSPLWDYIFGTVDGPKSTYKYEKTL